MSEESDVARIPATERAVVGLCHDLNDQLAAVSAYTFLLKRRDLLGEADGPLQERLDEMARAVRLVRSLCRDPLVKRTPVAVSILAEAVSDILRSHPEGPIRCRALESHPDGSGVVRCEWASTLRSLLVAAVWVRRGISPEERVEIQLTLGPEPNSLLVSLLDRDEEPTSEELQPDPYARGIEISIHEPRSVVIVLPSSRAEPTP